MKNITIAAVLASMALAATASADIYVHGRSGDRNMESYYTTTNNTAYHRHSKFVAARLTAAVVNTDAGYWTHMNTYYAQTANGANAAGTKRYFNWNGTADVVTSSTTVNALRAGLPAGGNVTRTHSTGGLINARLLALYGTTPLTGKGYISRSVAAASAEGGSEMADTGTTWIGGVMASIAGVATWPVDNALRTPVARSFTHNFAGSVVYHGGGSNCDPEAGMFATAAAAYTLPGEDDGAVAYHSTLGKNRIGRFCDVAEWYTVGCDTGYTWNSNYNYTGHVSKEHQYWGHGVSLQYAGRGW